MRPQLRPSSTASWHACLPSSARSSWPRYNQMVVQHAPPSPAWNISGRPGERAGRGAAISTAVAQTLLAAEAGCARAFPELDGLPRDQAQTVRCSPHDAANATRSGIAQISGRMWRREELAGQQLQRSTGRAAANKPNNSSAATASAEPSSNNFSGTPSTTMAGVAG